MKKGEDEEIQSSAYEIGGGAITDAPSPTHYIRWDIEVPMGKGMEWSMILQEAFPLKNKARPVLVFPVTQTLETTFAFSLEERQEQPVNIQQMFNILWEYSLMSDAVLFMIPRTPWSLAAYFNKNAIPQAGDTWQRHLFQILDKRGYKLVTAIGLKYPPRNPTIWKKEKGPSPTKTDRTPHQTIPNWLPNPLSPPPKAQPSTILSRPAQSLAR